MHNFAIVNALHLTFNKIVNISVLSYRIASRKVWRDKWIDSARRYLIIIAISKIEWF